jgi:hypothetical protein
MNEEEQSALWRDTAFDTFQIPYDITSLFLRVGTEAQPKKPNRGHTIADQNTGWDKDTMQYRAKISYAQSLILQLSKELHSIA